MKFNTEDYAETHGRNPKATDVAVWNFYLCRDDEMTEVSTQRPELYSYAKRFAFSEAKAVGGIVEIYVCP